MEKISRVAAVVVIALLPAGPIIGQLLKVSEGVKDFLVVAGK